MLKLSQFLLIALLAPTHNPGVCQRYNPVANANAYAKCQKYSIQKTIVNQRGFSLCLVVDVFNAHERGLKE
jgi:hypothetical protein